MAQCANFIVGISTHTPLAGRDNEHNCCGGLYVRFLLTRPSRDVTRNTGTGHKKIKFLLTRPSRDVTASLFCVFNASQISTHTPLAGRDHLSKVFYRLYNISTHTPLAGRDSFQLLPDLCQRNFYSHAPRGT